MASQKSVTVLSIHNGIVLVEYSDHTRDRFPLEDFPHDLRVADRVKLGLQSKIQYAIIINGEDVPSTRLTHSFHGYVLSFTSTSDSGHIDLEEEGEDILHVVYKTDSKTIPLGMITAKWDESHVFAVLSFSSDKTSAIIRFEYLASVVREPVELFFDHTTFYVVSDKDKVEAVLIKER